VVEHIGAETDQRVIPEGLIADGHQHLVGLGKALVDNEGTVARAFELARAGTCRSINDIRRTLRVEGFNLVEQHLAGASIKKQLVALMRQ